MPAQSNPVAVAQQELSEAKRAYENELNTKGYVEVTTNTRYLEAIQALNDARFSHQEQVRAEAQVAQNANRSVEAVLDVVHTDMPEIDKMDSELVGTLEQAFIGYTDFRAHTKAKRLGIDPANWTPQQYAAIAREASVEMGRLAEYFREQGRQQAKAGFALSQPVQPGMNRTNVPGPVTPANASGNVVPAHNQFAGTNINNHKEMARKYAQQSGRTV